MARYRIGVSLLLAVASCSSCSPKSPSNGDVAKPERRSSDPALIASTGPGAPTGQTPPSAAPPADGREAELARAVLQLVEGEHLLRPKVDDALSRTAFGMYLDRVDGAKMFLLKSDRDALRAYEDKIDDELRSGALDLAHDGAKRYAARVATVQGWVAELLAQPFDFSKEEFVELDPKKVEPATTEAELKDRWRRRLELEVLERVSAMEQTLDKQKAAPKDKKAKLGKPANVDAPDPLAKPIPTTPEAREQKAREDLARAYSGRFKRLLAPSALDAAADELNAVTASIDPHSDYLPPAEKANFDIAMTGSLEGIGAVLREKDHLIEIAELVPGGASWRQGGLTPGDLILSVSSEGKDPVDVTDMPIDDVVHMIRGPKGTVVHLRVQKASGEQQSVAITRDKIVIEATYARAAVLNRKGKSYGYILLPSFYGGQGQTRTAAGDVARLLTELKAKKVQGIVLDIRGNGGGLLGDAVKLTGELIDKGPVVQVRDSRGRKESLSDDDRGEAYDGPVIVMVDQFSASASEIVAAALQDYHRAVIVGTGPTHGKGTVQTVVDLDRAVGSKDDLGSLKLTIEQFFRVNGPSTQREGVTPDVVLPNPAGYLDTGERQLDHALPASRIEAASHDTWPGGWSASALASASAARVAKSAALSKIAAATTILRARKSDTRVPLQKAAWEARRVAQKKELDDASPDLEHAPAAFEVNVLVDPLAPVVPPPAGAGGGAGKTVDPTEKWRDNLARDPWLDEALNVFGDLPK